MTKEKAPSFHGMIESMEREAFEAFVSSPPFEYSSERMTELSAWPGNYRSLAVQLAWEAWKASAALARKAAEADRERICNALPGGYSVDPQWVADMVLGMVE